MKDKLDTFVFLLVCGMAASFALIPLASWWFESTSLLYLLAIPTIFFLAG